MSKDFRIRHLLLTLQLLRTEAHAAQKSPSAQQFQIYLENTLSAMGLSREESKRKITLCLSEKLNGSFPLRYAN